MRKQKHRARGFFRAGRVGLVAVGLGAALGMTGCAAAQVAQTAQEMPAVNGAVGQVGKIALRDASLVYPAQTNGVYAKGSDVELELTIVNRKPTDDKLVKVSSKAASSTAYEGSRVVPGSGTLVVGMPAQAGTEGAQPSESAAAATSAVESARDENSNGHARIVLRDITVPVRSGQDLRVTFTFREAGSVTLSMPVATPTHPRDSGGKSESGKPESGKGASQTGHPGEGGPADGG